MHFRPIIIPLPAIFFRRKNKNLIFIPSKLFSFFKFFGCESFSSSKFFTNFFAQCFYLSNKSKKQKAKNCSFFIHFLTAQNKAPKKCLIEKGQGVINRCKLEVAAAGGGRNIAKILFRAKAFVFAQGKSSHVVHRKTVDEIIWKVTGHNSVWLVTSK
jgi:hypothetical protein